MERAMTFIPVDRAEWSKTAIYPYGTTVGYSQSIRRRFATTGNIPNIRYCQYASTHQMRSFSGPLEFTKRHAHSWFGHGHVPTIARPDTSGADSLTENALSLYFFTSQPKQSGIDLLSSQFITFCLPCGYYSLLG